VVLGFGAGEECIGDMLLSSSTMWDGIRGGKVYTHLKVELACLFGKALFG